MRNRPTSQRHSSRDAIRVMLALVFILFASMASREHDSAEKTFEQQEIADAQLQQQIDAQTARHQREAKHPSKLPEVSLFSRLSGAISGSI